jgi:hypothetical protein
MAIVEVHCHFACLEERDDQIEVSIAVEIVRIRRVRLFRHRVPLRLTEMSAAEIPQVDDGSIRVQLPCWPGP